MNEKLDIVPPSKLYSNSSLGLDLGEGSVECTPSILKWNQSKQYQTLDLTHHT
jgi:hypothetical protein